MNTQGKMPMLTIASSAEPDPPFLPSEQQEAGMSMAQVFAIIWAHRKISMLISFVLIVLFAGFIKMMPKSFNAQATVIVNYQANDPLLGEQAFPAGLMDSYVATQLEVIQSSSVLVPVVEQLKLTDNEEFMVGYNGIGSKTDWAKAQLLRKLTLNHPNYTQLIYIGAESRMAEEAALLANTVAKVYLSQQQERLNTPATERAEQYAEQLNSLKEKVAAAQAKVTEFRQRNNLTNVEAGLNDPEVARLNDLEQRYQDIINAERAAIAAQENQRDVGRAAAQSGVVNNLRISYSNMQTRMAELKTQLGPNHPRVVELQTQMDSTQKALDAELQSIGKESSSDLTTLRDLAAKLKAAADEQRRKVLSTRRLQDDGGKLIMELESAQAVYRQALDGYDRVLAAAGGQSSNLRLMSAAEVPLKSTKPNKPKLFVMAFAASMFIGIALPFARDFLLQRKIRCRDDVEHDLRIPVLAEFEACPALLTEGAR